MCLRSDEGGAVYDRWIVLCIQYEILRADILPLVVELCPRMLELGIFNSPETKLFDKGQAYIILALLDLLYQPASHRCRRLWMSLRFLRQILKHQLLH